MNIQSISIVVPTKGCVNHCKFCVSRMHNNDYKDKFDEFQIKKRIKFAVNNGVNTCIITGTGEALQNKDFLLNLQRIFMAMGHPFPNVEFQTSGVMLMESEEIIDGKSGKKFIIKYPNIEILKGLGVNTISLSLSDIFDSDNNAKINGIPEKLRFNLYDITKFIKDQGFNLRLSLNMTNVYDDRRTPEQILRTCKGLRADQITFRKLYSSDDGSEQSLWVKENACNDKIINNITEYIVGEKYYNNLAEWYENAHGKPLYRLPFGAMVYSIMGMSVVMDDNCMSKNEVEKLKYVILRENGKLYCQWDDEGSLIF